MKKFLYILGGIISVAFFSTIQIKAEDDMTINKSTTTSEQVIRKTQEGEGSTRPKAPSNQRIYFAYDATNGVCLFTLPVNIEYIDIELTCIETQIVYSGSIDSISPIWHQPLIPGEYYIVCTADNGDIYSGYIYI